MVAGGRSGVGGPPLATGQQAPRTNATIAARLRISDKTVRNHVSNIFAKLAVADLAHAIVRAREAGLGTSGRCHDG